MIHEWWGFNEQHRALGGSTRERRAGPRSRSISTAARSRRPRRGDGGDELRRRGQGRANDLRRDRFLLKTDPRITAPKRAVIGWCFGGGWSLQTALAHPELDGAIIYYGQLETDPAKLARSRRACSACSATRTRASRRRDRREVRGRADKTRRSTPRSISYDAPHAFANPSNPKYVEPAATEAWTPRPRVPRQAAPSSSSRSGWCCPASTRRGRCRPASTSASIARSCVAGRLGSRRVRYRVTLVGGASACTSTPACSRACSSISTARRITPTSSRAVSYGAPVPGNARLSAADNRAERITTFHAPYWDGGPPRRRRATASISARACTCRRTASRPSSIRRTARTMSACSTIRRTRSRRSWPSG